MKSILAGGAAGLVIAAWDPPAFDIESRVRFVMARHHRGSIFALAEAALAIALGPLEAPATPEAVGHLIADDLRTLDLGGGDADLADSKWTIAVVNSRREDDLPALERYLNHALYEGWLYGPNAVSVFDDEDRHILQSTPL